MKYLCSLILIILCILPLSAQDTSSLSAWASVTTHIDIRAVVLKTAEAQSAPDLTYDEIEVRVFAWLHWGDEEIDWFHNVYTPLYGNPEEYIYGVWDAMQTLEAGPAP
jgi:hypothetical protein